MSIAEEHGPGLGHSEYFRRYDCNVKVLTWSRDSYGLYDYEMRNPVKTPFKFDVPKALVRVGTTCYLEPTNVDIDTKYKNKAQLLAHIYNHQNRYVVRPGPIVKWEQATPAQREVMKNQEIELNYREEGEQQLEPNLMNEPMYLVVRSIIDRGVKQNCVLKENDIIKFGRAKFRVQEVVI